MTKPTYQAWNDFVPQLYLKRFASSPGHIWHYRLLVSHETVREWKEVSISRAGAHDYLYSFADDTGQSDKIERWLSKEFEGPAEDAIDKAVSEKQLSKSDWKCLIRFLCLTVRKDTSVLSKKKGCLG